MTNVGYDVNKLPLGELSEETVKAGYKVLRELEDVLTQQEKNKLTYSQARK